MNGPTSFSTVVLQNGLSIKECLTSGSTLEINTSFQDCYEDDDKESSESLRVQCVDTLGAPINSFESLEKEMEMVDLEGYVKKKLLEKGGGISIHEGCTVDIAYAGYWEQDPQPFDFVRVHKPEKIDLKNSGLLPGLTIAIKTMLVGELSVFLLSYQVMYGIFGMAPKIKPKARCVYYIKVIRSTLTSQDGSINFSEPKVFHRVYKEVTNSYMLGVQFYKMTNYVNAIQIFKKAVHMLHKVRLADESEEKKQEQLLIKLYMNLAVCYNKQLQPLKACTACNEISRLTNIWNNGKALFQNAKALRMIGEFKKAEKKLKRAMHLCPDNKDMREEEELLLKTWKSYNKCKIIGKKFNETQSNDISEDFKAEVDALIEKFKTDVNLCTLTLPMELNNAEVQYIKEACKQGHVFCSKVESNVAFDKIRKSEQSSAIDV